VLDTFASFGLIGVAVNLALFCAWWRDAIAAVRTRGARLVPAIDASELDARWALIGVVIAFGASSAIDYTWYFPGVAVPALVAAGWVAGVGAPLRATPARHAGAGPDRPAPAPARSISTRPGAILGLTALAAVTLAVAWESLQPMRSVQSADASQTALLRGDGPAALADAHAAVSQDPLSANALAALATADEATGQPIAALAALVKATQVQPDTAQPFARLGGYLLCRGDFHAAEIPLRRAQVLDITDSNKQNEALTDAEAGNRRCGVTT
jgi:tetratricopeptide (TPR) repeat protein